MQLQQMFLRQNPLMIMNGVNDLYDNLFKIVFGEDYDINKVTYDYKTQTYHYEDETVTEEQLGWLVYYCVYSK